MGIRPTTAPVYTRRWNRRSPSSGHAQRPGDDVRHERARGRRRPDRLPGSLRALQIWFYERIEELKSKVYLIFYQPYGTAPTSLAPRSTDGGHLVGWAPRADVDGRPGLRHQSCFEWRTVQQALQYSSAVLGSGAFSMRSASLLSSRNRRDEGVDQILSMTTGRARRRHGLGVARLVRFPEMRANKIGMDLSLLVPKAELKSRALGEEELLQRGRDRRGRQGRSVIDNNFKYASTSRPSRSPARKSRDRAPLLYPGQYKLILKISDGNQNAEGASFEALTPRAAGRPPPELVAAGARKARRRGQIKTSACCLRPSRSARRQRDRHGDPALEDAVFGERQDGNSI